MVDKNLRGRKFVSIMSLVMISAILSSTALANNFTSKSRAAEEPALQRRRPWDALKASNFVLEKGSDTYLLPVLVRPIIKSVSAMEEGNIRAQIKEALPAFGMQIKEQLNRIGLVAKNDPIFTESFTWSDFPSAEPARLEALAKLGEDYEEHRIKISKKHFSNVLNAHEVDLESPELKTFFSGKKYILIIHAWPEMEAPSHTKRQTEQNTIRNFHSASSGGGLDGLASGLLSALVVTPVLNAVVPPQQAKGIAFSISLLDASSGAFLYDCNLQLPLTFIDPANRQKILDEGFGPLEKTP